jgi:hypothetical protein
MGNVLTKSCSGHPPPPPRERNSHRVTVTDTDQKVVFSFSHLRKKTPLGSNFEGGRGGR